jgi:hypothetical protein
VNVSWRARGEREREMGRRRAGHGKHGWLPPTTGRRHRVPRAAIIPLSD